MSIKRDEIGASCAGFQKGFEELDRLGTEDADMVAVTEEAFTRLRGLEFGNGVLVEDGD